MTVRGEAEYLEQFEVVPYAVDIASLDLKSANSVWLQLKIVLQSRSWSSEDASRVRINSVVLFSRASNVSENMLSGEMPLKDFSLKMDIEVNESNRTMIEDFERLVAVYSFELALSDIFPDLSQNAATEYELPSIEQKLASLMMEIRYGLQNSRTEAEALFQGEYIPSRIRWQKNKAHNACPIPTRTS